MIYTILTEEILEKLAKERIEELLYEEGYDAHISLKNENELHDLLLSAHIGYDTIEEYDYLYYQMASLISRIDLNIFQDILYESEHPYDPWREHCDKDFYGV